MMEGSKPPTYSEVIRDILSSVDKPILASDAAKKIWEKRETTSKDPHRLALQKIRDENGRQLIYVDKNYILPTRAAMHKASYRIRLNKELVDQAVLPLFNCFLYYLPYMFDRKKTCFIDFEGKPLSSQIIKFSSESSLSIWDLLGMGSNETPGYQLREWFRSQRIYHKDHILVTIEDWEQQIVRLQRVRFREQNQDLLAEQNKYMADNLYELLEAERAEYIDLRKAIPAMYAQVTDKDNFSPEHIRVIANQDARMKADEMSVHYADDYSMFERIIMGRRGQKKYSEKSKLTEKEKHQVYRFRATLTYKPSIWREIDIQGKHTLDDLDIALKNAFDYGIFDHLSGFWKRVERSGTGKKRFREVDLAEIHPYEGGYGGEIKIASLNFKAGDQLKYIYDFGDSLKHILELKSISETAVDVEYPLETARNKPKYEYCEECKQEGRRTKAVWECYTCFYNEKREIFLCEKCADKHEDHHLEKIMY